MKILITGGAGFIGSNLVEYFLNKDYQVVCLDDLSTGYEHNISHLFNNPNFTFIKGDIRDKEICQKVVFGCDYVCHQAALGSVPRSIDDPGKTNSVNIDGFLNILIAARDAKVKRFVYAASSSTYGDSKLIPKVENEIGLQLSPYAITKYVNELYSYVFAKTYGMQCIGLRYFNVFGKRQDPIGSYAAVIPSWINKFMNHKNPIINGDGSYSRDFTFIENVIQANDKAIFTPTEQVIKGQKEYYNIGLESHKYLFANNISTKDIKSNYFSEVFNIAYGDNTTLLDLFFLLRKNLSLFDDDIKNIEPIFGPFRVGDIPHSQASILKAKTILKYSPEYNTEEGIEIVAKWYYDNIK
ncbi:MAG: NAD-dependent epimerase/dehydratase family protein [Candidatus Lokiarchaeota archaeon]|nr:NAD-dependent epimerase/dehydratase family protein [Candidatus Lokiarchaeota archaeon]